MGRARTVSKIVSATIHVCFIKFPPGGCFTSFAMTYIVLSPIQYGGQQISLTLKGLSHSQCYFLPGLQKSCSIDPCPWPSTGRDESHRNDVGFACLGIAE